MIEPLRDAIQSLPAHQRLNGAREYLQRLLLQALDQEGLRKQLAFTNGTALHLIFGTQRFSEDLDFSLIEPKSYTTKPISDALERRLRQSGLRPEIWNYKDEKTIASFSIRFADLLHPLGLSPNKTQKLSIKFEVDKRPPLGGEVEETLIQNPFLFLSTHYTLPSLFATKLHAILFRRYIKGRDYYDLLFYLGKKVRPSLKLFQNAVKQTHPDQLFPSLRQVYEALQKKIGSIDDPVMRRDVEPFLLNPEESRFIRKDIMLKALSDNAALFIS